MTRILLIGAAGQVGRELQESLPALGEVIALDRRQVDLTQPDQIRQAIRQHQPHYIVNAAAYTAVDRAESEPELAQKINTIVPTILAEETERLQSWLLHLSTDYVFDGTQSHPYRPSDPTRPLGVYGQSKRAGEEGIQRTTDRYTIVRTAWVYGVYGKSHFVKTMLRLATEREELRVVADQIGSPTWAWDLAQTLRRLIAYDGQSPALTSPDRPTIHGIFHFTNSGVASWYDFAVAILEEARSLGWPIQAQRVIPIATEDYPTPAKRPAYSVLDHRALWPILGQPPTHWRASLRTMLQQLRSQPPEGASLPQAMSVS